MTIDWRLLALAYWLHMVATVIWVGGLALMALVVWPAARAALGPGPQLAQLAAAWQRRFAPLAWGSLAVLVATGLAQMAASPNYDGLMRLTSGWAVAILAKHLAVGAMVALGVYQQWWVLPALARLALLEARGRPAPELAALRHRQTSLNRLSLGLGLAVLALTAVARVL